MSIDDFIISYFTAGSASSTLAMTIYGMTKKRVTPEVNAISTLLDNGPGAGGIAEKAHRHDKYAGQRPGQPPAGPEILGLGELLPGPLQGGERPRTWAAPGCRPFGR